jgi:hypothetical protein
MSASAAGLVVTSLDQLDISAPADGALRAPDTETDRDA